MDGLADSVVCRAPHGAAPNEPNDLSVNARALVSMTNSRVILPIALYIVQVTHDYGLELVLVRWGRSAVPSLSALLPIGTSAATALLARMARREHDEAAPWRIVAGTGALLGVGSCVSLYALEFVDFRTRLVAKACKPAFVSASLGIATWLGYSVRAPSWPRALAVGIGGALYAAGGTGHGDAGGGSMQASLAIGTAVMAEAIATTLESSMLTSNGSSAIQLAGQVNMCKVPFIALAWWLLGGEAQAISADLALVCLFLALAGSAGQLLIFACVREFGGEFTSSLGTGRKALTYGLSSVAFGTAPIGGLRIAALAMVAAGMMMPARRTPRQRRRRYAVLPTHHVPV